MTSGVSSDEPESKAIVGGLRDENKDLSGLFNGAVVSRDIDASDATLIVALRNAVPALIRSARVLHELQRAGAATNGKILDWLAEAERRAASVGADE